MKLFQLKFLLAFLATILVSTSLTNAQIKQSSTTGFLLEITRTVNEDTKTAYQKFVNDFSNWYDVSHSYSQKAENLSLDLEKCCMLEKLDDGGYVRHMEIVFHQPGKVLRMTGGLGPLQGMGVSGALTITFTEKEGKTVATMSYAVSGADFLQLDKIAVPVMQVLEGQMSRYENWCNIGAPNPKKE